MKLIAKAKHLATDFSLMRKFLMLLFGLILSSQALQAQEVLLGQDVKSNEELDEFGPNRKHYFHFYLGLGTQAGDGEHMELKYGQSGDFIYGLRYKRRLSNFYAVGMELAYNYQAFGIKQKEGKFFPDTVLHDKEQLKLHNLFLGLYQRFNFGRRGNHIGKYIDLGVYGSWNFDNIHFYKDKNSTPNANGARKSKTKEKDLEYMNSIQYGAMASLGYGRFVIYSRYRLSDLIEKGSTFPDERLLPELPRYTAGLQINILK